MNYLKWLMGFALLLTFAISMFLFYMRFHDGPIEIFAGGAFKTGESIEGTEPDWSALKDRETIQFQTLEPARSRTTWLAVHQGKIYTPSGYMNSKAGKIWKQWPRNAMVDGRALMRIDGKIYKRQLIRINADDPATIHVLAELNRKYKLNGNLENIRNNDTWLFQLAPRY